MGSHLLKDGLPEWPSCGDRSADSGLAVVLATCSARSPAASLCQRRDLQQLLRLRLQVGWVRVKGPRYWPQLLVSTGKEGGGLGALYKTQTLFVQRKAGALPYANDPSGGP